MNPAYNPNLVEINEDEVRLLARKRRKFFRSRKTGQAYCSKKDIEPIRKELHEQYLMCL